MNAKIVKHDYSVYLIDAFGKNDFPKVKNLANSNQQKLKKLFIWTLTELLYNVTFKV